MEEKKKAIIIGIDGPIINRLKKFSDDGGFGNVDKADIHGTVLPATDYGIGSMRGLFIMKGPGIKKGSIVKRNIQVMDLVTTLCYLTDWPIPKDAEGAVLYQILEDPDMKQKELGQLKKNYLRFKNAYKMTQGLTHSFDIDELDDDK